MTRRRALLGSLGASVALSGCLEEEDSDSSGPHYQECDAPWVDYEELPQEVATEVDATFENGEYQTNGTLLYSQVTDGQALWKDERRYIPHVETRGEMKTLLFYARPPSVGVSVDNETEDPVDVTITIRDTEEEIAVGEEISLSAGEDTSLSADADSSRDGRLLEDHGVYDVTVTAGRRMKTATWDVTPGKELHPGSFSVTVRENEIVAEQSEPVVSDYGEFTPCGELWGTTG